MPRTKRVFARGGLIAALLLSPAALGPRPVAALERELDDPNITEAILRECVHDPAVPFDDVRISTTDGIVTLTGTVDNILARDRAVRIAETVRGVRSVIDRVEVKPPENRDDVDVRDDIEAALLVDPATDSYDVDVEARDGKAVLTGTVQSWRERELCATVAKGVRGVTDVSNRIDIRFDVERPDREMLLEIRQTLRWDTLVDGALIDVAVDDGKVTLTGTVGSAAEKRQARYDAWTNGVRKVDVSGLEVERWARDEDLRKGKYGAFQPAEVEQALQRALRLDPRVAAFRVETSMDGSLAILRGTVDNLMAKRAAASDARNTVGVLNVDNRLRVEPETVGTDEAIERAIRLAFARDPYVWSFDVAVRVEAGTAHLSGVVDSYFDRARAADLASGIAGVVDVVNDLEVRTYARAFHPLVDEWELHDFRAAIPDEVGISRPDKSDALLAEDIESQLWWSPFVDAADVDVRVENGVATLTGKVDTWAERAAARDNAYDAGAILVENELEVD